MEYVENELKVVLNFYHILIRFSYVKIKLGNLEKITSSTLSVTSMFLNK